MCGLRIAAEPAAAGRRLGLRAAPSRPGGRRYRASSARRAVGVGRVGPAGERGGPDRSRGVGLAERGEGRAVEDHRPVELVDQAFQLGRRDALAGLAEDPAADLGEGRPAVEVADDLLEAVERDQDRVGEQAERVFEGDEGLALMVDPSAGERAEPGAVERRHPRSSTRQVDRTAERAGATPGRSIHCRGAGASRQAVRRGPRGVEAIRGSDQAGGAASRGGWGFRIIGGSLLDRGRSGRSVDGDGHAGRGARFTMQYFVPISEISRAISSNRWNCVKPRSFATD